MNHAQGPTIITPGISEMIRGSVGLSLTDAQLRAIATGAIESLRPVRGCVTMLTFGDSDEQLIRVFVKLTFGGETLALTESDAGPPPAFQVANLSKHRDAFQQAANFGHGVVFLYDGVSKLILQVSLVPCACPCPKARPNLPTATPVPDLGLGA